MTVQPTSSTNLVAIAKEKQLQNNNQNTPKKEIKDNKKKIISTLVALATIGAASVGIAVLTKNHKKAAKVGQNLIQGKEEIVDEAKALSEKLKLKQQLDIDTNFCKKVPTISTSVAEDVENWDKLRSSAPKFNKWQMPINTDFDEFPILPHSYVDDTDILIHGRDYTCDFSSYKVEDGKISSLVGIIPKLIKEKNSAYHFELQPDGRCLQTGLFEDGRKYVSCSYLLGETVESNRKNLETLMLVSKGKEFTQSQKDLIKAFECSKGKRFKNDVPPMIFGKYIDRIDAPTSDNNQAIFLENKNALLSTISSWAENVGEFDIENFLKLKGDIFRIGK